MVHWDRYRSRSKAVGQALGQIVESRAGIGSVPNTPASSTAEPFLQNWNGGSPGEGQATFREKWEELFPGTKFPESPSEYELLKYTVISMYADSSLAAEQQVIPEKDLVRAQLATAATQNKIY
jgi:hypothetical protein